MDITQEHKTHGKLRSFTKDLQTKTGPIPLSYSVSKLSKIIVANASNPFFPKLTPEQQEFFVETQEQTEFTGEKCVVDTLQRYFEIFDDALYFGLLKNHVDLDVRTKFTGRRQEDEKDVQGWWADGFATNIQRGCRTPSTLTPNGEKSKIVLKLFDQHPEFPQQRYIKNPRFVTSLLPSVSSTDDSAEEMNQPPFHVTNIDTR